MLKEMEEIKRGRERAEKYQRDAEEELLVVKNGASNGRDTSDGPISVLLQKEKDKNAALEDSICGA